ncbi:MAG: hypothetical protein K0S71_2401 [Clostridia bacterium]|jgi:AraC-like DNA-binding protein|nr:hypothetical protein [Clostridia bacterium]
MEINEAGVLNTSEIYFCTPSNSAKAMFFYLTSVGHFYCNGDYVVTRDTFNSFLLMYVVKGGGSVTFEGKTYAIKANDLIFLNCHKPHSYRAPKGWEIYWLHFDSQSASMFFDLVYEQAGCVIPLSSNNDVRVDIEKIIQSFTQKAPLAEPIVSAYLHTILTELIMCTNAFWNTSKGTEFVLDAIIYIEANYNKNLTLQEIAEKVNISPFHFSRVFKKETGYAPYEYIIKTRINHAKILLKSSNKTVKQIGYEVGFNSETNFIQTFRRMTQMTPYGFKMTPVG